MDDLIAGRKLCRAVSGKSEAQRFPKYGMFQYGCGKRKSALTQRQLHKSSSLLGQNVPHSSSCPLLCHQPEITSCCAVIRSLTSGKRISCGNIFSTHRLNIQQLQKIDNSYEVVGLRKGFGRFFLRYRCLKQMFQVPPADIRSHDIAFFSNKIQ